ncbi:inositol-trisphosphate 3-kinase-like protein isoform X2 [Arctopsyche grandis]|uniref:inositol-trisphosphate 3-kinase-like protein isoform X2 n=1 Tax=Arctopsyche grandis TaxID=121162 RepID=UPI00406D655E
MSGGLCEPPARLQKLTARFCLRALDQYDKILHFKNYKAKNNNTTPAPEKCDEKWKSQSGLSVSRNDGTTISALKRWKNGSGLVNSAPSNLPSERLQYLAINALELTAPASDVLLKGRAQWFQLSGHPDSLAPAGPGTVWKRRVGSEDAERCAYEALSACPHMQNAIPRYYREVEYRGDKFIELQDLLHGFEDPHVMDIKMGARTFLETEVSKTTARSDLYEKMIAVDPNAPTELEHAARAVTKLRYMQFREQQSSTNSEGFRIEGIKMPGEPPINDLKRIKSEEQVMATMAKFLGGRSHIRQKIVKRLKEIRSYFEQCEYFKTHEVIGSSIFLIFDENSIGAWLIDFAKTQAVPEGIFVTHRTPWKQGNYEEGFLFGMDRLIKIMETVKLDSPMENASPIVER